MTSYFTAAAAAAGAVHPFDRRGDAFMELGIHEVAAAMAFMHLGGEAGATPSFFEVYAADKLVPTLRGAIIYSLSVCLMHAT